MKIEKKLSKLKMPMKKDPEEEMDLAELDAEDEELPELDEDLAMEGEEDVAMDEEMSPAAALSDEELLAEIKKRGIEKDLDAPAGEESEDEDDMLA